MTRIAILGWGSLLWEPWPDFDRWRDAWRIDGLALKLEFSRISSSRKGALTLVIDPVCGVPNPVAYSISARAAVDDALADLQRREGTTALHIGYVCLASSRHRYRDLDAGKTIEAWGSRNGLDAVIWTDLPSNFEEKTGLRFSVTDAIEYLKKLDESSRSTALQYICQAPPFVQTPLRSALGADLWFKGEVPARG